MQHYVLNSQDRRQLIYWYMCMLFSWAKIYKLQNMSWWLKAGRWITIVKRASIHSDSACSPLTHAYIYTVNRVSAVKHDRLSVVSCCKTFGNLVSFSTPCRSTSTTTTKFISGCKANPTVYLCCHQSLRRAAIFLQGTRIAMKLGVSGQSRKLPQLLRLLWVIGYGRLLGVHYYSSRSI